MKQVVLIMVDIQRKDMVGCYPDAVADTPNLKGEKPTYDDTGMTRQPEEEDYVQLDYDTGLPIKKAVRKK